jgi:hypothetical protein
MNGVAPEKARFLLAKHSFCKLSATDISDFVDELMNSGSFSDEFIEIIVPNPTLKTILQPFLKFCKKEGLQFFTQDQAAMEILRYHLLRISNGLVPPCEGLSILIRDIYWDYEFHSKAKKYVGDSHKFEILVGLFWSLDDILEHSQEVDFNEIYGLRLKQIESSIFEEANRWLMIQDQLQIKT